MPGMVVVDVGDDDWLWVGVFVFFLVVFVVSHNSVGVGAEGFFDENAGGGSAAVFAHVDEDSLDEVFGRSPIRHAGFNLDGDLIVLAVSPPDEAGIYLLRFSGFTGGRWRVALHVFDAGFEPRECAAGQADAGPVFAATGAGDWRGVVGAKKRGVFFGCEWRT
jgi:hypothetical protein